MEQFWNSGSGKVITGNAEHAFLKDFTIIPDGTIANSKIIKFCLVNKLNAYTQMEEKYYEVTFKMVDGDFKNREVGLKLKVFDQKTETIDRNLNMMKLIMDLSSFKPAHNDAPTDSDLMPMIGKMASVKIVQWDTVAKDGKLLEGNRVSEVYKSGSVPTETGQMVVVTSHAPSSSHDSALNRNSGLSGLPDDDSGIPF
jgi:hypothetical protein